MKLPARTYTKATLNLIISLVTLLLCIYVLPKLVVFFMPFLIGWFVACMAAPCVRFFEEKLRIRRKASSVFVIVLVIGVVIALCYAVVYFLIQQIIAFAQDIPALWESASAEIKAAGLAIQNVLYRFPQEARDNFNSFFSNIGEAVTEWLTRAEFPAMDSIGNVAKRIPSIIVGMVVALLASYFFVTDKKKIGQAYEQYCPKLIKQRARIVSNSFKNAIGGYLKAQLKIELWVYLLLVLGLFLLKVPYGWLIGIGISFLDFLPIFGTGTVMIPWAVIKFLDGDIKMGIGILVTWGIGQLVRQIIQPKIVGDSVGLPALPTLFLIYLGYQFGGFGGMIIAMPVGIIVLQLYQEGMFDTTVKSGKIILAGLNHFRKIRDEDLLIVHQYEREASEEIQEEKKL